MLLTPVVLFSLFWGASRFEKCRGRVWPCFPVLRWFRLQEKENEVKQQRVKSGRVGMRELCRRGCKWLFRRVACRGLLSVVCCCSPQSATGAVNPSSPAFLWAALSVLWAPVAADDRCILFSVLGVLTAPATDRDGMSTFSA